METVKWKTTAKSRKRSNRDDDILEGSEITIINKTENLNQKGKVHWETTTERKRLQGLQKKEIKKTINSRKEKGQIKESSK